MELKDVLKEIIQMGGVFEVPEYTKIKMVYLENERHIARVLFYDESTGSRMMEITLRVLEVT